MTTTRISHSPTQSLRRALRLMTLTAAVAVAGGVAPAVFAQTAPGPDGAHHAGMHHGPGMGRQGGPEMGGGKMGDHMMGGGMMGGHRGERMLDSVGATADQKAQVRQIMQAAHKDMQAQHEGGRAMHEQMRKLLAAPNIDTRAVETLRQQMLAHHDGASKRMTQAMVDAAKVLTPEQRKHMSDRMAQRREMMQRHRAERQGMMGGAPAK